MTIPRFDERIRRQVADVIKNVVASPHSAFYREWFTGRVRPGTALTAEVWNRFPFLTRERIMETPMWERTYIPRGAVHVVRSTSGTSTRRPLLTPRCVFGSYETYLKEAGVTRQLSFIIPWFMSEEARRKGGLVHMNCHHPESYADYRYAARLVKRLKADSVYGYPHAMIALAPFLSEEGVIENIRAIELTGERCSEAQRRELLRLYNNPIIYQNYSASEWRGMFGVPCARTLQERLLSFHLEDAHFLSEFIDPDTGQPGTPHSPMELVLTSLTSDQPFPLIRYRTGDLLVLEHPSCPCGGGARFQAAGRAASDRIRMLPGEFSTLWIEQAIARCVGIKPDDFEAHYVEDKDSRGILIPGLEIRVVPDESYSERDVTQALSEMIKVGSDLTYDRAREKGMFLPLRIAILTEPVRTPAGKRSRLIRAL